VREGAVDEVLAVAASGEVADHGGPESRSVKPITSSPVYSWYRGLPSGNVSVVRERSRSAIT
jgi:hypothetical protein